MLWDIECEFLVCIRPGVRAALQSLLAQQFKEYHVQLMRAGKPLQFQLTSTKRFFFNRFYYAAPDLS